MRSLVDFLDQRYSCAKPIINLNPMHFLITENGAIYGYLCHSSQNVFQKPSNSLFLIVAILGKFHFISYAFFKSKGGEERQVLRRYDLNLQGRIIGLLS